MYNNVNISSVDPHLVEIWVRGWAIAREVAPPVKDSGVLRVEVGWPDQQRRYVFPAVTNSFRHLAATIVEPWVFLKVCAPQQAVSPLLPSRWQIQDPGFMMICSSPMAAPPDNLPGNYTLDVIPDLPVPVARILTADGTIAAMGRIALVDNYVIYDRIETHPDHRRRGLGSRLMKALESLGAAHGNRKGILVATTAGRALYETLGWQLYSQYTSVVIPGPLAV